MHVGWCTSVNHLHAYSCTGTVSCTVEQRTSAHSRINGGIRVEVIAVAYFIMEPGLLKNEKFLTYTGLLLSKLVRPTPIEVSHLVDEDLGWYEVTNVMHIRRMFVYYIGCPFFFSAPSL